MTLDFSTLAQPAAKARGQVGTTGTPASTRVCASPLAQPGAGTTGDKPAAVLAADRVVAVPAACPPVSPACTQATDAEKFNAGAVSPVSPLVPTEAAQVAAAVRFEREDLAGETSGASVNTCGDFLHLLRRGTCGKPVAAGLLTAAGGFGIVWPPEGHGAACPAFTGRMPTAAADRPHRLTNDEADRCHAPCWDEAEIAAFTARTERFALLGRTDADDLAERLTLRDRDGDDRRLCLECTWLGDTGRCLAAATGRIPGADRRLEPVQTILQRCGAFGLRKGLV
jgi:hypothetical protein